MALTFWIAIYGAIVATASLVFNYLRDPQPIMRLTSNHVAWGKPGMHSWNIHLENRGEGIARDVRLRVRRGRGQKWSAPEMLMDVLKPSADAPRTALAWWHTTLEEAEYSAMSDPAARATWRARITWSQGPVRLVGRRSMTISPRTYSEPQPGVGGS